MIKQLHFFSDENIQQSLIEWLKSNQFRVSGIRSENLYGLIDETIIEKAFTEEKIIITQDSDF